MEQKGETNRNENSNDEFQLICHTNINKSIEHQILWMKNDREIFLDEKSFTTRIMPNSTYANSVLVFKSVKQANTNNLNGKYQCKLHIRYPDVGQGGFYVSEVKEVAFSFFGTQFYPSIHFIYIKNKPKCV